LLTRSNGTDPRRRRERCAYVEEATLEIGRERDEVTEARSVLGRHDDEAGRDLSRIE
jgi:hypothetical protein